VCHHFVYIPGGRLCCSCVLYLLFYLAYCLLYYDNALFPIVRQTYVVVVPRLFLCARNRINSVIKCSFIVYLWPSGKI